MAAAPEANAEDEEVAATAVPVPVPENVPVAPAEEQAYPVFIESYLAAMDGKDSEAFSRVVLENAEALKTRVKPVETYESEQAFVADYFRSCSKYAKHMPIAVTEMLYAKRLAYVKDDKEYSRILRKMIAAYYARRKEEDTLGKCEKLCRDDVQYYLHKEGLRDKPLPPLKKLVVMCCAQKRFDEALALCDLAIEHNVIDAKGAGYEARKNYRKKRERKNPSGKAFEKRRK